MDPKNHAIELIKQLIEQWGLDEAEVKDKKDEIWWFTQGSVRFHIQIFTHNAGGDGSGYQKEAIEICANIMKLPESEERKVALYKHVLGMNNTAVGVWFAVRNDSLMLMSTRSLEGLDLIELKTMADDVRLYADYFDDIFKDKFGEDSNRHPAQ